MNGWTSALLALFVTLSFGACTTEAGPTTCTVSEDAVGSCVEACRNLYAIECRVGAHEEECVSLCEQRTFEVPAPDRGRVLACYAAATDCLEVDACARTCGSTGTRIRFTGADGGVPIEP